MAKLSKAIERSILSALKRAEDRVARIDVPKTWPVPDALAVIHGGQDGHGLRVGVLRPFRLKSFSSGRYDVSDLPTKITSWRNTRSRTWPLVVCGRADAPGAEGVRDFAGLIKRATVISEWRSLEGDDAANAAEKPEVGALVSNMFSECQDSRLDAVDLDEYLSAIAGITPAHIDAVFQEMWRAGLVPDDQALDKGASGRRLTTNRETVDRLQSEEDRNTRARLRAAARENTQRGQSARAALAFADSGRKSDLAPARLSDILAILGEKEPGQAPDRSSDLTDLLNSAKQQATSVIATLKALDTQWKTDDPELTGIELDVTLGERASHLRVQLQPVTEEVRDEDGTPHQVFDCRWLGTANDDHILVACLDSPLPEPYDGTTRWSTRSVDQFRQVLSALADPASGDVRSAFENFVTAREALRAYEPWLERNAFELLVICPKAREAVGALLEAWRELLKRAVELHSPGKTIRFLQLVDAAWGPDLEDPRWAVLGPLHPYRLDPLHRVTLHLAEQLEAGRPIALGDAAAWLRDRCYPAYPAIYSGDRSLHLSRAEGDLVYMDEAQEHLPRAEEGSGLGHCIECLEGFAPQLAGGLVLLLIDPPLGRAIVAEVSRLIARHGQRLTVLIAATRSDANALDDLDGNVHYVGRFAGLPDWVAKSTANVHVAVRFAPQPKGTVAARYGWSATRGSFLAPHLEVSLDPLTAGEVTPVAEVKIEPRRDNGVVFLAHELYRKNTGNTPRHFQFRPLLPRTEVEALKGLADRADWLIVAAPGPMGIATPSRINTTLNFVGRDTLGPYGLYVYATDQLFTVRRFIEHALREVPVNVVPEKVAEHLAALAKQSGAAILRMGKDGIDEHQAALVSLRLAHEAGHSDDYLDVVLRVDDLGWTRIWIGDRQHSGERQRRCDFLLVRIARVEGVSPRIIVRAIESKSDSSTVPLSPSATVSPFSEGKSQIATTLKALGEVLRPEGALTLDEDVRFSTFIEHLMAAVLSTDPDFSELPRLKASVETLNALSARALRKEDIRLEGYVVVTQSGTNADTLTSSDSLDGDIALTLVRATAKAVSSLFGADRPTPTQRGVEAPGEQGKEGDSTGPEPPAPTDEPEATSESTGADLGGDVLEGRVGDQAWAQELAQNLVLICERHSIPIAEREPSRVILGPSLVAVAVRLKVGAQLGVIEKRLEDLTRDIGLGEKANEISVMNDAEPSTVRFLIPRPHREFPQLPSEPLPIEWDGAYLPVRIGRTLEGRDLVSCVENWPHMLIAGTTGSGKTTFLRNLLRQITRVGPGLVQLVVVDGKGDTDYLDSVPPDMLVPEFPEPLLGHSRVNKVMEWAVREMESRRATLHEIATKGAPTALKWPEVYRSQAKAGKRPPVVPTIIVIDEFADLMLAGKSQADAFLQNVQRVAQVGRSRMIHLILATQRPDKETIRGAIKTNLDARVVLRLPTAADSLTVLGKGGAERLLKHGDMLFECGGTVTRLQGYSS